MAKRTRAALTADSEARLAEKGGGRFPTLTLQPEEMELWERLLARDSGKERGKAKRTLMRALHALEGKNQPSNDELLAMLKERMK